MPNWCENRLRVSGDADELQRFLDTGIKDGVWRISNYLPMPKALERSAASEEEMDERMLLYGARDWYEWRKLNYGCKWDCEMNEDGIERYGDVVEMTFLSPWTSPVAFLRNVQRMFPELEFQMAYMETGCWFAGIARTVEGEYGMPEIEDVCGEPVVVDEDGNHVDTSIDGFDLDEFLTRHSISYENPFEEGADWMVDEQHWM